MSWLLRLFCIKPSPPAEESRSEYAGFTVEHYPITGRFYPTWDGKYIWLRGLTGTYETISFMSYGQHAQTAEEAWAIIDLVREQQLKVNVRVLTR